MARMAEQNIIVTGANGGLGRAICSVLQEKDARVIGIDIGDQSLDGIDYRQCDISDLDALASTLESIVAEFGAVFGLVNNAAHYHAKSFFDITPEDFDRTMAVNLRASFFAAQTLGEKMIEAQAGAIVNIGSLSGHTGSLVTDYSVSKAGLVALTQSLAKILGPNGIRVNAVAPGMMDTPMGKRGRPEMIEKTLRTIPIPRAAHPREVAQVVAFLIGDEASYVNGAVYHVNGGAL